ncbi:MAG: hypothetical protein GF421_13230 [Candidatus Aminicenantes bacterium]|nr:hypothetical protein [Candidatus Aminicenantes bacterium]
MKSGMLEPKRMAVFLLLCVSVSCLVQADSGTVTAVYDGDTIQVRLVSGIKEKIRLIGVDAPETGSNDEEIRLKALYSKRFAFRFLYKKQVRIEYDWEKRDKYGRLLAYIRTEEGTFFNEYIIQKGFASAYTRFPYKPEYKRKFLSAEKEARTQRNGLWKHRPYALITKKEAAIHMGDLVSYEFLCTGIEDKGNLRLLTSENQEFAVPVYKKYLHLFPDLDSLKGKNLIISGLLEHYKGQPQIMLFSPSQLQIRGHNTYLPYFHPLSIQCPDFF